MRRQRQKKWSSETKELERSTAVMELQLDGLKNQLKREKELWEKKVRENGGNRWRSGNSTSSLSKYGRNKREEARRKNERRRRRRINPNPKSGGHHIPSQAFQFEGKQQGQQGTAASSLSPRSRSLHNKAKGKSRSKGKSKSNDNHPIFDEVRRRPRSQRYREKIPRPEPILDPVQENAKNWSSREVQQWLTSIGLPQYGNLFVENAITGEVLLEIESDDLDYLNIRALGHRKRILSGIKTLKNPTVSKTQSTKIVSNPKQSTKKIHWSVATVNAQEKAASMPRVNPPAPNLADGEYDEARERQRFAQAVQAWRTGGSSSASTKATTGVGVSKEISTDEGGIRDLSSGTGWSNPFSAPSEIEGKTNTQQVKNSFWDGEIDEAKEHEKFAAAVDEWRRGRSTTTEAQKAESTTITHKRLSCYQCYKLFDPSSLSNKEDFNTVKYCSKECQKTATMVRDNASRRAAERRMREEKRAKDAEDAVLNGNETFDYDDAMIESNISTEAKMNLDYDIWNTEIKF